MQVWAGHITCMEIRRDFYRVLVGNLNGKRQLESPRRGLQNNIKMFQEVGCNSVGWIVPAQERYRWRAFKAVNLRFAQILGNFLTGRGTGSFSGRKWLNVVICNLLSFAHKNVVQS